MFKKSDLVFILNSFLIIFGSYLFLHMAGSGLTALGASKFFEIPSTLSRWGLRFTIPDSSDLWTYTSVIGIYAIAPVFFLIVLLFTLRQFYIHRFKVRTPWKLFMIWLYIHAFNLFFGGLGLGIVLKKGFGYVPRWAGIPEPYIYFFTILGVVLLLINGLIVNDFLSAYAFEEKQLINSGEQRKFKFKFIGIPVLIFVVGNLVFGFPDRELYTIGLHLSLLLILPGSIFYHECLCDPNENPGRWRKLFPVILVFIAIGMISLSIISIV